MLEIKNIVKLYQSKDAETVRALDGVSAAFPETGLVFLLGKSGSGKSTMLNVIGGLDSFDEGEIVVKGKSSVTFTDSDFDSYRNTYIGFIFQEYNILEDFSVEKNLAFAIELQGKKPDKEEVERILREVDLEGLGKRKPNQLSGGQKQRVAIARALIKNPEIIMADEPTGALDSVTGKQVLDTLKRLSATRLVIVVSHDREFAEQYADRIIEMADGKIISDVTKRKGQESVGFKRFKLKRAVSLRAKTVFTAAAGSFTETTPEDSKGSGKTDFKLIKSRLSIRDSIAMGASNLKHKKFRLVLTILLSAFALIFFGLADTIGSFGSEQSMYDSIKASGSPHINMLKHYVRNPESANPHLESTYSNDADIAALKEKFPEHFFAGAYRLTGMDMRAGFSYLSSSPIFRSETPRGYSLSEEDFSKLGLTLGHGKFPAENNEILITDYHFETYKINGYSSGPYASKTVITKPEDILGKTVSFYADEFTVTGIVDTGFNYEHFSPLLSDGTDGLQKSALSAEIDSMLRYGVSNSVFFKKDAPVIRTAMFGGGRTISTQSGEHRFNFETDGGANRTITSMTNIEMLGAGGAVFFDGGKTSLADDEALLTYSDMKNNSPYRYSVSVTANQFHDENGFWKHSATVSLGASKRISSTSTGTGIYDSLPEYGVLQDCETDEEFAAAISEVRAKLTALFNLEDFKQYLSTDVNMQYANGSQNLKIAGVYFEKLAYKTMRDAYLDGTNGNTLGTCIVMPNSFFESGIMGDAFSPYQVITTALTGKRGQDFALVKYAADFDNPAAEYLIQNEFTAVYGSYGDLLNTVANIGLGIGVAFALFASLMMGNFISTSVAYKKREIGILRAIGARKSDTYKIFLSESLIITLINFFAASVWTGAGVFISNTLISRTVGLSLQLLHFGIRQIAIILALGLAVAFVASFWPVRKIGNLNPIDAIQNRK